MGKERREIKMDFDGVITLCKNRGVIKTHESIAKETGYAITGFRKLRKVTPKVITMLYYFLKENDLKFDDLVKEVESKKE